MHHVLASYAATTRPRRASSESTCQISAGRRKEVAHPACFWSQAKNSAWNFSAQHSACSIYWYQVVGLLCWKLVCTLLYPFSDPNRACQACGMTENYFKLAILRLSYSSVVMMSLCKWIAAHWKISWGNVVVLNGHPCYTSGQTELIICRNEPLKVTWHMKMALSIKILADIDSGKG